MTDVRTSHYRIHRGIVVLILATLILAASTSARAGASDDIGSLRDVVRGLESAVVWIVAQINDDEWAQGTGFIIDENGYIVTNAHVVAGSKAIVVGWPDRFARSEKIAEVVAMDEDLDLALLHIDAAHLPTINVDPSSPPHVGDAVISLGYPAGEDLGLGNLTVTRGIISCIRAAAEDSLELIQTDAAVTLGCSGGPLYDLDTGTVVGVIQGKGMFLLEGFNFAIPVERFFDFAGSPPELGLSAAMERFEGGVDPDFSFPSTRSIQSYNQGLLARGSADWGEALSHFLAATRLDEEDPLAAYSAAESYAALHQPRQALRWLEKAFELGFSDFDGALDRSGFQGVKHDRRFVELVESF